MNLSKMEMAYLSLMNCRSDRLVEELNLEGGLLWGRVINSGARGFEDEGEGDGDSGMSH